MNAWKRYTPTQDNPWTLEKVGHLHRRAGFGATWDELQRDLKAGPDKAIDRVLEGGPRDVDFDKTSEFMARPISLPAGADGSQLAAWWLARILGTPHPLKEKLTLFWHNHFATSLAKVRNARYMLGQYRLINEHAIGHFGPMLKEMSLDPAMMIWLDTITSTKEKPNENYARELMELFSLGIGHYTETDIREAAKAFTGYELRNGKATFNQRQHDASRKTVLGKSGHFKAEEIVEICLAQDACAEFIVRKMFRLLISESELPSDDLIQPLAELYRAGDYDTAKLVETMLRSELFFSAQAYRQAVKNPVEFAVGIVRGLEGNVGPLPLAQTLGSLGQTLFAPPSVKGWDGGPVWLNGQTLLFRQNLALALTSTTDNRFGRRCDPARLLKEHDVSKDEEVVDFLW